MGIVSAARPAVKAKPRTKLHSLILAAEMMDELELLCRPGGQLHKACPDAALVMRGPALRAIESIWAAIKARVPARKKGGGR